MFPASDNAVAVLSSVVAMESMRVVVRSASPATRFPTYSSIPSPIAATTSPMTPYANSPVENRRRLWRRVASDDGEVDGTGAAGATGAAGPDGGEVDGAGAAGPDGGSVDGADGVRFDVVSLIATSLTARVQSRATWSPTAVGSIRTSGANSEAYSTNAAGGSTSRSGNTRPIACGQ